VPSPAPLRPVSLTATGTEKTGHSNPFFGQWPAITENHYGAGRLLYEGTYLSDGLQRAILLNALKDAGLMTLEQQLPTAIHAVTGVNQEGKRLHYYFNYSGELVSFTYPGPTGKDLLTNSSVATGQRASLKPWDLIIVEEQ
jgi:beta-galactosidase